MTGLDPTKDHILEAACIVTNADFKHLATLDHVVYQPPEILSLMDNWCKKTHGDSGLTKAVATGTPLVEVEDAILKMIDQHFPKNEKIVLAGNSVGNDLQFLLKHCPKLAKRLHYRVIDVSSFKEIFKRKYHVKFDKKNGHRALDDIVESINELKYYLTFFKVPEPKAPKNAPVAPA